MSPIDLAAYEASEFNRGKIDRYAARIARETKRPTQSTWSPSPNTKLGPHWVVFEYSWHERQNFVSHGRPRIETDEFTHQYTRLALLSDGRLIRARIENVEIENTIGPGMEFHNQPGSEELSTPTDLELLELDHSTKDVRWDSGPYGKHIKWGNRPGPTVVRHAKGVGISMALKKLLDA